MSSSDDEIRKTFNTAIDLCDAYSIDISESVNIKSVSERTKQNLRNATEELMDMCDKIVQKHSDQYQTLTAITSVLHHLIPQYQRISADKDNVERFKQIHNQLKAQLRTNTTGLTAESDVERVTRQLIIEMGETEEPLTGHGRKSSEGSLDQSWATNPSMLKAQREPDNSHFISDTLASGQFPSLTSPFDISSNGSDLDALDTRPRFPSVDQSWTTNSSMLEAQRDPDNSRFLSDTLDSAANSSLFPSFDTSGNVGHDPEPNEVQYTSPRRHRGTVMGPSNPSLLSPAIENDQGTNEATVEDADEY